MEGEKHHQHQKWLDESISNGLIRELDALTIRGLQFQHVEKGLLRFKFVIPEHLSDKDGNWHAGAIAVLIDDISVGVVFSSNRRISVSVNFDISYFSPAKIHEEVEIEGKVVAHKDRLTLVAITITKKDSGEMVAFAKQWMSSTSIQMTLGSSKL
ncbi:uncharacterized protein LOC131324681 [Rhododendron vialii]|uniref:uncharacterized protein LOC131324681 n=1 Tax=Rhododendron vialii TaxID=182163 RepID=UPI00265DC17C|nr:uncharacterized protein LOC131324681 [Rhododendron vialii]